MLEGPVKVINPLGLHARAAAQLVKLAGRFESRIMIGRNGHQPDTDAKSMLDLLTLAAAVNSTLTVRTAGPDEAEALSSVQELFACGFGEM